MEQKQQVNIFWFRRDLRLEDNVGLYNAVRADFPIVPIFIFDKSILDKLHKDDARVSFIHQTLSLINEHLLKSGKQVLSFYGSPKDAFAQLLQDFEVNAVYCNEDYEPYAIARDEEVKVFLETKNVDFQLFKDQVIFAKDEVMKADGTPYTVYTPFKNKWLSIFNETDHSPTPDIPIDRFLTISSRFLSLEDMGFQKSTINVIPFDLSVVGNYENTRNLPGISGTSWISPHLRFGTIGIRTLVKIVKNQNIVFLQELIWREFFMQILYHFPQVVNQSFKPKYDAIPWRNNVVEFEKWCKGETGYPMVDAGIRELNATGYMHNRVRMVVASFLCKHLLIDWRWGEAYFAEKLLDFELSSNNGNWQWAAGTGCDAAPYFRVFNPEEQFKKFDPKAVYVKKWVPEFLSMTYAKPVVEHKMARLRALDTYKKGLSEA